LNRAEKRSKRKLDKKNQRLPSTSGQTAPDTRLTLELAIQHHHAGRLHKAESIYQQILHVNPHQPVALHLLGLIAHQRGDNALAVDLVTKAIALKPDYAEAHSNLGKIFHELGRWEKVLESSQKALILNSNFPDAYNNLGNALKELGRLEEAVENYKKAIAIDRDYAAAYCNLGNALHQLGRWKEVLACSQKALVLNPNFAEAYNTLGNALKELGRLNEAIDRYNKAVAINPDYVEAYNNLGIAYLDLGKKDEAFHVLQTALEKQPANRLISASFVDILDHHIPANGPRGTHAKAQEDLQRVTPEYVDPPLVSEETLQKLYQQCQQVLDSRNLSEGNTLTQMWRGQKYDQGCTRHMVVFNTFNIIPEYCFGCFKVQIEPRSVVELIKLMMIFNNLDLENDNTRKCIVEIRPEISGTYKGLIYCHSLDEAKEILEFVQGIVEEKISNQIPAFVKRGCSEYPLAYPQYGHIDDKSSPLMSYNEEWREHEDNADKHLVGHTYPYAFDTYNHSGFTLRDALVLRTWIAYAAAIGDLSYLKISGSPVQKMAIETRAAFQPVDQE